MPFESLPERGKGRQALGWAVPKEDPPRRFGTAVKSSQDFTFALSLLGGDFLRSRRMVELNGLLAQGASHALATRGS